MDTNFLGTVNTLAAIVDLMTSRKRGHIAVISSLSAYYGMPGFPAYSASKAALLNYCQGIRGKLALYGIKLTIICPGYIQTPMTEKLPRGKFMVVPVENAARAIKDGLVRGKQHIAFPILLRSGLWILNILPVSFVDKILGKIFSIRNTSAKQR